MLQFVKTSHIAQESIEDITRAFKEHKPDIVALELDEQRLQALNAQERNISPLLIPKIGLTGYLFLLIGNYLQEKMGETVGIRPGQEMLTAYRYARSQGVHVTLIDQPITETMERISNTPFREKLRLVTETLKGIFTSPDINVDFDLTKVPTEAVIEQLKDAFHDKFPYLYRVLVLERNYAMANKLRQLKQTHPDATILVILGAGHGDVEKLL